MKQILFNQDMIKAILDGRKTVTRRVIKKKYDNTHFECRTDKYGTQFVEMQNDIEGETHGTNSDGTKWHKLLGYIVPKAPYKVGDTLYVRETWQHAYNLDENDHIIDNTGQYLYAASPETCPHFTYWVDSDTGEHRDNMPWRPSIHMPKEAARIFLKVTDVRVERLQDITEEQAKAEGIKSYWCEPHNDCAFVGNDNVYDTRIKAFAELWDSLLPKNKNRFKCPECKWHTNPYVWIVEFERCEKPSGNNN